MAKQKIQSPQKIAVPNKYARRKPETEDSVIDAKPKQNPVVDDFEIAMMAHHKERHGSDPAPTLPVDPFDAAMGDELGQWEPDAPEDHEREGGSESWDGSSDGAGEESESDNAGPPPCINQYGNTDRGEPHLWMTPHAVVRGSKAKPGIWEHNGKVEVTEVCGKCRRYRVTDSGMRGVVVYREADARSKAWKGPGDSEKPEGVGKKKK